MQNESFAADPRSVQWTLFRPWEIPPVCGRTPCGCGRKPDSSSDRTAIRKVLPQGGWFRNRKDPSMRPLALVGMTGYSTRYRTSGCSIAWKGHFRHGFAPLPLCGKRRNATPRCKERVCPFLTVRNDPIWGRILLPSAAWDLLLGSQAVLIFSKYTKKGLTFPYFSTIMTILKRLSNQQNI